MYLLFTAIPSFGCDTQIEQVSHLSILAFSYLPISILYYAIVLLSQGLSIRSPQTLGNDIRTSRTPEQVIDLQINLSVYCDIFTVVVLTPVP